LSVKTEKMSMNEEIPRLIYTFVYLVSTLLYRSQHINI
jgi:hypothetical protein